MNLERGDGFRVWDRCRCRPRIGCAVRVLHRIGHGLGNGDGEVGVFSVRLGCPTKGGCPLLLFCVASLLSPSKGRVNLDDLEGSVPMLTIGVTVVTWVLLSFNSPTSENQMLVKKMNQGEVITTVMRVSFRFNLRCRGSKAHAGTFSLDFSKSRDFSELDNFLPTFVSGYSECNVYS